MKSRNKTLCLWSVYFQQRYKSNSVGEKRALKKKKKTNSTGTIEYACAPNQFRPLPHTVHKNELKDIIDFNARGKSMKLLEENARAGFCKLGLGKTFLGTTLK